MKETKNCQNCQQKFAIESEDFDFYKKMVVPPPTFCPECRLKRRLIWRNEHVLFRRKNDAPGSEGKEIFSGFPPQVALKIYDRDYWWSDAWDATTYGRDYDFSKPFFEQFKELMYVVPWASRSILNLVNSDYSDQAGYCKNCYLCFNADFLEDCTYCIRCTYLKDCVDLYDSVHSELSYESVMVDECYRVIYSLDCESSTDVWFSKNLTGCTHCFGCVNLRKKSYHIFNEPYSKEAYFEKLKSFNLGSYKGLEEAKAQAFALWKQFPVKYMHGSRNVSSSGEHIQDSKNVNFSVGIHGGENLKYCGFNYLSAKDSYDYNVWGNAASQLYECLTCGEQVDNLKFCFNCYPSSRNLEYCIACHSSSDLFGCVGLRKKQYCIFNKQYTKEEYFALREKIIAHMESMPYIAKSKVQSTKSKTEREIEYKYGEFFPSEFSPFAYNETMIQDFFPLTKEEAEKEGYVWREQEAKEYTITIAAKDLPDTIEETTDSVVKEIIGCMGCNKPYRIISQELALLKRIGIPLPRFCSQCRFLKRLAWINPLTFSKRKCACAGTSDVTAIYKNTIAHAHAENACPNTFLTSYPKDRGDIVYCEACYQQEVA